MLDAVGSAIVPAGDIELGDGLPHAPTDTERFWDSEAATYDAAHGEHEAPANPLWIRMAAVLRLLGKAPEHGSVLDCGMGPGRLLAELARQGWSVAGVDLSGEMVARARERLPGSAERLVHGTVESLPFAPESFDAVVATGVLEYVEDLPRALSEVSRVLRPGGLFVVATPNTSSLGTTWRHRIVYTVVRALKARRRFGRAVPQPRPGLISRTRLKAQLAGAGLEPEQTEYIALVVTPLRLRFASASRRLGRLLGGRLLGPLLASQVVVTARKRAELPQPHTTVSDADET